MLLIDADTFVYKAGFTHRGKEITYSIENRLDGLAVDLGSVTLSEAKAKLAEFGMEEFKLVENNNPTDLDAVLFNLNMMLHPLIGHLSDNEYKLFLTSTDHSNFRYDYAKTIPYKGNRSRCKDCFDKVSCHFRTPGNPDNGFFFTCKNCGEDRHPSTTFSDKPYHYNAIRDHLINNFNTEVFSGCEADDALGIAMYAAEDKENTVVVHIDKDINMVAGWHYNPDKQERYYISEEETLYYFYKQMLTGDSTDNIPGVKGVGAVTAEKILLGLERSTNPIEFEEVIMAVLMGETFSIPRFKNTMCLTHEEAYDRIQEVGILLWMQRTQGEIWKPTIMV